MHRKLIMVNPSAVTSGKQDELNIKRIKGIYFFDPRRLPRLAGKRFLFVVSDEHRDRDLAIIDNTLLRVEEAHRPQILSIPFSSFLKARNRVRNCKEYPVDVLVLLLDPVKILELAKRELIKGKTGDGYKLRLMNKLFKTRNRKSVVVFYPAPGTDNTRELHALKEDLGVDMVLTPTTPSYDAIHMFVALDTFFKLQTPKP